MAPSRACEVEIISDLDASPGSSGPAPPGGRAPTVVVGGLVLALGLLGVVLASGWFGGADIASPPPSVRLPIGDDVDEPWATLLAAERYRSDPSAATLGDLLDSIGGIEERELGVAAAPFDVVGFDPSDGDRVLADHPLAGRAYRRLALSGDRRTAVAVMSDGTLHELELPSGRVVSRFGTVDPAEVDRPITVNEDGSLAVTVERDGLVTLWFVGDDEPVFALAADPAQPRFVPERSADPSVAVVSADLGRLAVRIGARPDVPVRWQILDIDVESWVREACERAGWPYGPDQRSELGRPDRRGACGAGWRR